MTGPLVTLGVPVFRGRDLLPSTLECLRTQTYPNLDVLISVDAADNESAEACRPFLEQDSRFRLHVHPTRLGWAGNTDWTMRNRRGEFYIYQQHDDLTSPSYVADLVEAAMRWPGASICFSEMRYTGSTNVVVREKSTTGDPLQRALKFLKQLDATPFRGLIRGSHLSKSSGLLLSEFDPYDSFGTELRFLAELALAGEFRFVSGPTYYKHMHAANLHLKRLDWSEDHKRRAWACFAAWMIEVIVPAGISHRQRVQLFETVLQCFFVGRDPLRWFRSPYQRLRTSTASVLQPLRLGLETMRARGWVHAATRSSYRSILCSVGTAEERSSLLSGIFDQLKRDGRFHPEAVLAVGWEDLERGAARRFVGLE